MSYGLTKSKIGNICDKIHAWLMVKYMCGYSYHPKIASADAPK